jgi:hypothetical protein
MLISINILMVKGVGHKIKSLFFKGTVSRDGG